jgi:hypothetical protein
MRMKLEVINMKKFIFAFALVVLLSVSGLMSQTGHAEEDSGGVSTQELPSVH